METSDWKRENRYTELKRPKKKLHMILLLLEISTYSMAKMRKIAMKLQI